MSIFNDEVNFLRKLGRRFRTKESYIGALEDMHNEGLISGKALAKIRKIKNVEKQTIRRRPERVVEDTVPVADPCSGGRITPSRPC